MSVQAIPRDGKVCATVAVAMLLLFFFPASWGAIQRTELTLLKDAMERIPGESKTKELFFQLPEHVSVESGTELKLVLRASPELAADLFTVSLSLNGTLLLTRPAVTTSAGGLAAEQVELSASVPELTAVPGWNRLELAFAPSNAVSKEALARGSWFLQKPDCKLALAYSRLPMFPELGRFPASFGEEKLLGAADGARELIVTLVLPKVVRDVHLRACAIIAARLGQVGYLQAEDCGLILADANSWRPGRGNWIVLADWNELGQSAAFTNSLRVTTPLRAGEGLIAETILEGPDGSHRCLVISGADDVGIEKALLSLGTATVLGEIGPSPVKIMNAPAVPRRVNGNSNGRSRAKATTLNQAAEFLVPDQLLEHLAFVVPLSASPEELRTLVTLALFCGRSLPSSPALLPEGCGYDRGHPAPAARLQRKSVVLLGSARQWKSALPPDGALPVEISDPLDQRVRIQGRTYPLPRFEPTLTLLQLAISRWSKDEMMLIAGGWESFDSPKLKWMMTDPEAAEKIYGTVAAMDSQGRIVCYDTRHTAVDSVAERIMKYIPRGVSVEETERLVGKHQAQRRRSDLINNVVFYGFGSLLVLFLAMRLYLVWERARSREKAMREEKPLGANP